MKKLSVKLLSFFLMILLLSVGVYAAGSTVVYLADGGMGTGASASIPVGTLTDAYNALDLSKDCTVVVSGPFTQSKAFNYASEYEGSVTITSQYDGIDYRETNGAVFTANDKMYSVLRGKTAFTDINIHVVGGYYLYAAHNPLTMGEGIKITGDKLTGETVAKSLTIYGGYRKGSNNPPVIDESDVSITLLSGKDYYVIPFNRNIVGTYTGTANIYIGGTAEVGTMQGATGTDGSSVGDTKVTLTDNAVIRNFYGSTGNVTLNSFELSWLGGSITEIFEWNCRFTPTKSLTITRGTKLIASEKAQRRSNFNTIAALFDTVEELPSEGINDTVTPVTSDRTVVFFADGANGNGYAPEDPVGSLIDAFEALDLSKECTVVVCGPATQTATFNLVKEYSGSVTITSVYDGVDYRTKNNAVFNVDNAVLYICCGETKFENLDLHANGSCYYIFGLHNPITIGEGVTVTGDKLKGDKVANSITIYGGYRAGTNDPPLTGDEDVHITALSGSNLYIVPFSRTIVGTYTGTAYIYIGGTAQVGTLMGGAGTDGSSVGPSKITVADNASIAHFYGSTGNVTQDSIEFTWLGGDISKIFDWTCRYSSGKKLTITGGTKLIAAENVKGHENYALISSLFDAVETYTGTVTEVTSTSTVTKPDVKSDYGCARGLYTLGLAQGYDSTGTNFGLTDKMTRVQTVVQVIRFLGVEDEVKAGTYTHPFTDVPAWANNYVGYAYTNKITSGMSATKFGTDGETTEAQFLTFMLRAIGYSDADGDFVWSNPFSLAKSIGMSGKDSASVSFLRGDAFRYSWNALYATAKNGAFVYENLANAGVFTTDDLDKAASAALSAIEPIKPVNTGKPVDPTGYNIMTKAEYYDKTLIGFMSDLVGVLSGYEHVYQNGAMRVALPESWYKGLLRGPFAEENEHNKREKLLLFNEETQLWEVWTDDDYSIDILNQYVIRDSYNAYGTIASKASSDARLVYNQYDMGGGHRNQGAYGLAKTFGYIAPFTGKAEFGNLYSTIGEPIIQCETLGMDAAGMPNVAVNLSDMFSATTSDGAVNTWAKFMSALHAMAYFETDVTTLLRSAQKILPKDSYEYYIVDTAFALYEKYPTDWQQAVREADNLLTRYCYVNDITQNPSVTGAFKVLAVLYGQGGYEATEKILALAGYGGESSGASMLSVIGIMQGWEGLEANAKAIINEKIWQDGKGVIVNLAAPDKTSSGYWMHAANLPARIPIGDIVKMYQANFEKILVENGGYIDGENYYVPKYRVFMPDSILFEAFEDGLGAFSAKGNAAIGDDFYTGKHAAQVNGGEGENSVYATVTGLTVGAQYRISAYVSATTNTTAKLFAREVGATVYPFMTVHAPARYAQREHIFTATAATMEIGLAVADGTSKFKYACLDDILVERVEEKEVATASLNSTTVNITGTYKNVGCNEAYLKIGFTNTSGAVCNVPVTLNGEKYATVPFYATADTNTDYVYLPIVLPKDTNVASIQVGATGVNVKSASVVTVQDRF